MRAYQVVTKSLHACVHQYRSTANFPMQMFHGSHQDIYIYIYIYIYNVKLNKLRSLSLKLRTLQGSNLPMTK
jgi:hypothetical protein